jgi:hypothetical protein
MGVARYKCRSKMDYTVKGITSLIIIFSMGALRLVLGIFSGVVAAIITFSIGLLVGLILGGGLFFSLLISPKECILDDKGMLIVNDISPPRERDKILYSNISKVYGKYVPRYSYRSSNIAYISLYEPRITHSIHFSRTREDEFSHFLGDLRSRVHGCVFFTTNKELKEKYGHLKLEKPY